MLLVSHNKSSSYTAAGVLRGIDFITNTLIFAEFSPCAVNCAAPGLYLLLLSPHLSSLQPLQFFLAVTDFNWVKM